MISDGHDKTRKSWGQISTLIQKILKINIKLPFRFDK